VRSLGISALQGGEVQHRMKESERPRTFYRRSGFSEPVTIPAGSVQLQNAGDAIPTLIGGVDNNGNPYSDIIKAPAGPAFTSITIQPLQSLHSGSANDPQGTYLIALSQAIKDLNQPPLSLVAGMSRSIPRKLPEPFVLPASEV
jgi:hypothetical protein